MKFCLLYNTYCAASAVILVGLPHGYGYSNQKAKRKGPFGQERVIKSVNFRGSGYNSNKVFDSGYFIQLGDEVVGDSFYSVALSDDGLKVAFGSQYVDVVQVFQYNSASGEWDQFGSDITETYGLAVALSADGNILATSDPMYDVAHIGRVQVYQYSNNEWSQLGSSLVGNNPDERCGMSLALNEAGDYLAYGCQGIDNGGNYKGGARVFWFDNNEWNAIGSTIYGEQDDEYCGESIGFSKAGDVLAIGCPGFNDDFFSAGRIRVYQYDGSDEWLQLGEDLLGEGLSENFGRTVSLSTSSSGDVVVAGGSPGFGDPVEGSDGRVRVYQFSDGSFSQKGSDIVGNITNARFSTSLSLSSDANTLIGANIYGDAMVYTYSDSDNNYLQIGQNLTMKTSENMGQGANGHDISISADGMIVSVVDEEGIKVYTFVSASSSPPSTQPTLAPTTSSCCCCSEKTSLAKLLFATLKYVEE